MVILSKLVIKFSHILHAPTRKRFAHLVSVPTEQGCASGTPLTLGPVRRGPDRISAATSAFLTDIDCGFPSVPPENLQGKHNALKLLHHRVLLHSFQFSIRHRPVIRCCVV